MYLFSIILLFLHGLLLNNVAAVPLHLAPVGAPLFELFVVEDGEIVPLDRSNPLHMPPDPMYDGLPMRTQWNEYNEVQHVVLIELLDVHQYRKHFLQGPSWADLELSDEDVEDLRQSHFNKSYDPRPYAAAKTKRLQKRDPYLIPQHCDEHSVTYKSTGVVHNTNPKSIGALHLACQQICNPVKGTFTAQVTHQSSLGWSISSKDLPYAQQAAKDYMGKFAKYALGFVKELGLGFSSAEADSVAYSHAYQADCGAEKSACFLCERPNVIVRKGDSSHQAYTSQGSRCPDYDFTTTGWEGHTLYSENDANGAVWDICYTTNNCFQFTPVIPAGKKACPPNAIPYSATKAGTSV
ncbi:uncharacterized protein BKA78DRAFT_292091 [Phyllosticta capitalensis]|uniref:uncharacterized protein n=1 Tax=Phyllosticta capitalensis TaxID=121624 RepID=UPI00312F0061